MKAHFAMIPTLAGLVLLAACNPPASDQQLQEKAAQATETAKQQSKEVLAQARVAAGNAERTVDDVAAGVKQGMDSHSSPNAGLRVNINSAPQPILAALPGISLAKAGQIVDHRPYARTHDLVKDGLLTESEFETVSARITTE